MNQALQIRSALAAEQLPPPSEAWLRSVLAHMPPAAGTTALPTLVARAKQRLLAADLTMPGLFDGGVAVFPRALLGPAAVADARQDARLPHDVVVQVRDVENLAQSRWQQVEALEAVERGEQKRGREVIRVVRSEDPEGGSPAAAAAAGAASTSAPATATHRLVLQDAAGQALFALELVRNPRIAVGRLHVGEKLVVKAGTAAARGTLLLEPASLVFLGGQVEALHTAWTAGRLARLREAARTE